MANTIVITRLSDDHDCETCGSSYADGFRVTLNGEEIVLLRPLAHCFDGVSYDDSDMIKELLQNLGYNVVFKEDY